MASLGDVFVYENDTFWYVNLATIVYIAFVITSAITVFLFLAVLIKGNSVFKEFPFFSIVWNLAIVNTVTVFIQMTCVVPTMLLEYDDNSPWGDWYSFGSAVVSLSETAVSYLVFLISLNRFSVFVMKQLSPAFTKKNIKYSIMVTWVAIMGMCLLRSFKLITKTKFDRKKFEFQDALVNDNSTMYLIITTTSYIVPACVFLMYILIYISLRKTRSTLNNLNDQNNHNNNNNDVNLLIQGFALGISIMIWRTLQTIPSQAGASFGMEFVFSLLKSMAAVFNNILNPLLFFATNSTVRKTLKSLLKCESMKAKTVSDTDIPTARQPTSRFKLKIKNPLRKGAVVEPVVKLSNMDQIESRANLSKNMTRVA